MGKTNGRSQSLQDQGTVRISPTTLDAQSSRLNPFKIRVPSESQRPCGSMVVHVSIPSRSGYRQNQEHIDLIEENVVSIPSRSGYRQNRSPLTKVGNSSVSIPSRSGYRQNDQEPNKELWDVSQSLQDQGTVRMSYCFKNVGQAKSQSLQDQGTVRMASNRTSDSTVMSQSLQDQGTVRIRKGSRIHGTTLSQSLQDQGTVRMEEERIEDESSMSQSLQDQGTVRMQGTSPFRPWGVSIPSRSGYRQNSSFPANACASSKSKL